MSWYFAVLKKYAVFNGRARRKEYWYYALISAIVVFLLNLAGCAVDLPFSMADFYSLGNLYGLAVLLPSLGVVVRRLHDTDRSGWFALLGLIPIVGAIVLIVFMAQDSTPGENIYGPNPKEEPQDGATGEAQG
ncbi:MAG: hypothetical protein B0D92_06230 [Spirochaeta sp. LUC14_002_19_P3]|nr:MAG: hypothetical protein B0D92_06230 [Spirochaeta sp. LUC14_002_19_P3]